MGPDGSLYAGGYKFTISRWDGTTWHPLGNGVGGGVSLVRRAGGGAGRLALCRRQFHDRRWGRGQQYRKWDGASWSALGSGMNGDVAALTVDKGGNLYAGGSFTAAGGVTANRIARWDGTAWHPLGSGMDNPVRSLAMRPDGSLYAGGDFTTAGD